MNKIFLHLGLHKTATTSLQKSVFPHINSHLYIGRSYNPHNKQSNLYTEITNYCFSQNEANTTQIRNNIIETLKETNIILSEEWFTSDYCRQHGFNGIPWQERIERLGKIVEGLPIKILLTIRNPEQALHSLYCVFYKFGINHKFSSADEFALDSNEAKAYDFPYLNEIMVSHLKEQPYYLCYEDLIDKPDQYIDAIKCWLETDNIPQISHDNQSRYILEGKRFYTLNYRQILLNKFGGIFPVQFKEKISASARNKIKLLLTGKGNKVVIHNFSDNSLKAIHKKFKQSYIFLNNHRL